MHILPRCSASKTIEMQSRDLFLVVKVIVPSLALYFKPKQ